MYDVYERAGEPYLLEEAGPDEHPLAAVVSLPRRVFDLMANGDWTTAIEVAATVGLRDVNTLTNVVFWFRHPALVGQRIRADQPGLAREWLRIRDEIVRPAVAGGPRKSPAGPPRAKRTGIASSGLCWFGPPAEKTPELMAFMR